MTGTKRCGTPNCTEPISNRGYCHVHYRRRLHRGEYGYRDPAAVLAHLAKLRDLGWTWEQIGDAAGIAHSVPQGLWIGRYRRVTADRERALLGVATVPAVSHRGVDSCGTRRRVQALAWMGWPLAVVAERAGIPKSTLRTLILPTRRISFAYAAKVRDVYENLSHMRGLRR